MYKRQLPDFNNLPEDKRNKINNNNFKTPSEDSNKQTQGLHGDILVFYGIKLPVNSEKMKDGLFRRFEFNTTNKELTYFDKRRFFFMKSNEYNNKKGAVTLLKPVDPTNLKITKYVSGYFFVKYRCTKNNKNTFIWLGIDHSKGPKFIDELNLLINTNLNYLTKIIFQTVKEIEICLLYTSPSPRD